MNYFIILLAMIYNIESVEKFLKKDIGYLKKEFSLVRNETISENEINYTAISSIIYKEKKCRSFFISTDLNGIINSIFFGINGEIDKNIFESMVLEYGKPDKMLKVEKVFEKEEKEGNEYSSTTQRGSLRECTFQENPIFIIWNKPNFEIKISINSTQNSYLINFKLKKQ